jgi:hypothetical protein
MTKQIESYTHSGEPSTQAPNAWVNPGGLGWRKGRAYYASVVRDSRVAYAAGPFKTHPEALAQVDAVRALCHKLDAFSDFDAFGTVKAANGLIDGRLNEKLGIVIPEV